MSIKPLSQRATGLDKIKLGTGSKNKTTIASHGCTITCIAMLAGLSVIEVNDLFIKHKVYAKSSDEVFNIVDWTRIKIAIPWLEFEWRSWHYSGDIDNNYVKQAIENNGACLVEVDFDGTPRTDDKHWVLYVGGQKLNDPWTGTERKTSVYSLPTGFSVIRKLSDKPQSQEQGDTNMAGETYGSYLGVKNIDEAKTKLKEHLGETDNGVCNWGAEGDKGGFLGSARKKITQLEKKNYIVESELNDVKTALEEWTGTKIESVEAVFEALEAFHLEQKTVEEQVEKDQKAQVAVYTSALEAIKEMLRWAVFIGLPFIIQELLNNLAGANISPEFAFVFGGILRALDKLIHEYGKDTDKKLFGYDLKKGLTLIGI